MLKLCVFLAFVALSLAQTPHFRPNSTYWLRRCGTTVTMTYGFYCVNNEYGKFVALKAIDGSIDIVNAPDMSIDVRMLATNGKTGGKWQELNEDNVEVSLSGKYDLPHHIALFEKGNGKPYDWASSTGNPYIYFDAHNGYTCKIVGQDTDTCESLYCSNGGQFNQPCVFQNDYSIDLPKGNYQVIRTRPAGSIFVGRCNQWSETYEEPAFLVECTSSDPAPDIEFYPGCQSAGHNIALGMGIEINDHHKIVGSQTSPHKFLGYPAGGGPSACGTQGTGPHEDSVDDTCIRAPPMGGFIDKSAGNKQGEDCTFSATGEFTGCSMGGNPCLTKYNCNIGDAPCFQNGETDIIDYLGEYCSESGRCPGGCRCSEIRAAFREMEVDCDWSSSSHSHHSASSSYFTSRYSRGAEAAPEQEDDRFEIESLIQNPDF